MRILLALLLGACATSPADETLVRQIAGCWVSADGFEHQRWSVDAANPNRMIGQIVRPRSGVPPGGLSMEAGDDGWQFCRVQQSDQNSCLPISNGGGTVDHATVTQAAETLRIGWIEAGAEQLVFEGSRQDCNVPINVIPVP